MYGRIISAALCAALIAACGEQVPSEPAASSGTELCRNDFETCVAPVLSGQIRRRGGAIVSCMDSNCHVAGGNGGRFTLGSDMDANYLAASSLVNMASSDPNASLLLIEPVQDDVLPSAVAGTHGGGEIFPVASSDPATNQCTAAISRWISIRVPDQTTDPRCGVCDTVTPVTNTMSCGY